MSRECFFNGGRYGFPRGSLAGMLAVALLGTVSVSVFGAALDARLAEMRVPAEVRQALQAEAPKLAEAAVPPQVDAAARQALEDVLYEAFLRSFRVAMLTAAGLALASALCAILTIRDDPRDGKPRGADRTGYVRPSADRQARTP